MNTELPFRDPRVLLILLGLICQSFTVDSNLLLVVYVALWFLCVRFQRERSYLPERAEALLTLLGIAAAFWLGGSYGYNRLVFVGNGLAVYQLVILLRPVTDRERRSTAMVAIMHLAVGSQVIVQLGFLLVLIAALVLVPWTFYRVEAARFRRVSLDCPERLSAGGTVRLTLLMVGFFLVFPRFHVMAPAGGMFRGQQRDQVEMASGGQELSERLICRVEGQGIGYLKTNSLDLFDGSRWTASPNSRQYVRSVQGPADDRAVRRHVQVVSGSLLRNVKPTDGYVVYVELPFFQRPYVADSGALMTAMDSRANINYTYWTIPRGRFEPLSVRAQPRLVNCPPPSPRLRQWLDGVVGAESDGHRLAERLVEQFRQNFAYEIGAPQLDRTNPVDDFIFNEQRGHCERYASALAYLLRLKGIPARVALGFLPTEWNSLAGFYNVRVRDGHAWTEAWLPNRGWVIYDATPLGAGPHTVQRGFAFTAYEWVEYTWYSKVVEFGVTEQSQILDSVSGGLGVVAETAGEHLMVISLVLVLLSAGHLVLWLCRHPLPRWRRPPAVGALTVGEARQFYHQMLKVLARQGWARPPWQTPRELCQRLAGAGHPGLPDIQLVTDCFCELHYGERALTGRNRDDIAQALARLRRTPGPRPTPG